MALSAPTYLGHDETGTDGSSFSPSFTGGSFSEPQNDEPVVLGVSWQEFQGGSVDDVIVSGWGYTWTVQVLDQPSSYGNAVITGEGTYNPSDTLTLDFESGGTAHTLTRVGVTAIEWDGLDPTAVQAVANSGNATSLEATLSSFAAGSATYCFGTKSSHNASMSPLSPLTEIDDQTDSEGRRYGSAYYLGEDTSPGWEVDAGGPQNFTVIGVEFAEAAGGGTTYDETGLSESITFSDSATDVATRVEVLAEDITFTDNAVDVATLRESLSDTIIFLDSATDAARLAESLSETITFTISGSDNLATLISEQLSETISFSTSAEERMVMTEQLTELILVSIGGADAMTLRESDSITFTISDSAADVLKAREDLDELIVFVIDGSDVASTDEPAVAVGFSIRTEGRVLRSDQLEQDRDRERVSK